eukprot:3941188-Rhodomonas_salina.6
MQGPYNLYQECVLLYLISHNRTFVPGADSTVLAVQPLQLDLYRSACFGTKSVPDMSKSVPVVQQRLCTGLAESAAGIS